MKKEDVKMPSMEINEQMKKDEKSQEANIVIPGLTDKKENVKKPVIISSDKY